MLASISAFEPSSRPSILYSYSLSVRLFRYVFLVAIFFFKIARFLLHPVVGMFSCHLLPVVGRIFFRCFGMSSFVCFVLPFVNISLIFLLSPVLSGLFPQVVLLFFLVRSFPFLSAFPAEFPILVLIFSLSFFMGSQCSHKLISPLHRLVHSIRLYYSLIYKVVLDLFHSFLR